MLNFTAGCICSAAPQSASNPDNLLFAGQILPESNGGLSGCPSMKGSPDAPFLAAVFSGKAAATHTAAEAFRSNAEQLNNDLNLRTALINLNTNVRELSAAAVYLYQDRLITASLGSCRCFLCRENSLFLFAESRGSGAYYSASGPVRSGDQLFLTTGTLPTAMDEPHILNCLTADGGIAECLGGLTDTARKLGSSGTVTAVLIRIS